MVGKLYLLRLFAAHGAGEFHRAAALLLQPCRKLIRARRHVLNEYLAGDDAGAFVILLQKRGHYLSRVLAQCIHGVMLAAYNAAAAHEQGENNVVLAVPRKREHVPLSAGLCHHCALLFAHALNRVRPVAELGGLFVFHIVAGLLHLRAEHIAHGGGVSLKEAHNAIEQLMVFLPRYVARTRRAAFV